LKTRVPKRSDFLLSAALALLGLCGAPVEAAPTVLKGFTLIDGTGAAPVSDAAMVIEAGRITWIGRSAALSVAPGAEVISYTGRYVIPGLVDLHVHLGNTVDMIQDRKNFTRQNVEHELRVYASYGVTTLQSLGTDSDLIFSLRAAGQAAALPMARVYTAGRGFVFKGGYGGLAGVNVPVSSAAEVEAAVAAEAARGSDIIKMWIDDEFGTLPKMPPPISKAIIAAAHRHKLRAVAHVFYLADAKRLVAQGIDGFAHSIRDLPVDQGLIDAMKRQGTWQMAGTLSREASMFAYGERAAFLDDPFFTRAVSAHSLQVLADPQRQQQLRSSPHFADYPRILKMAQSNTRRLLEAGIPLGFGTDSGPPGRFPGYFEHWELVLLVEAGLTPMQALQVATRDSARFLNARDIGILQVGKSADLVVLDADPIADIRNTRRIHVVYVAGRRVETPQQP
jgi:imidazolonepropionase-like amidohydrolase